MADKPWTALGRIHAAAGRLVLNLDQRQVTLEFHYLQGTPVVVAHVDSLSTNAQRSARDYLLRFEDLPALLEHAANILRRTGEASCASKQKPAPTVCRLK